MTADASAPPATPASVVLTEFVHEMVDYLVRLENGGTSIAPATASARQRRAHSFDSVHDQWLHALRSSDGWMEGDDAELAKLAEQIREWRRPIAVTAAAPVKLCFRLEEPMEAGEDSTVPELSTPSRLKAGLQTAPWRVRFLLQPTDDPSLLVEAGEVWKKRSDKAALLKRGGCNLKEFLLSALGQTAGICPRIEAGLKTSAPSGYELDAAGAHEFLTDKAWGLEQAGFGVLLPAWWTGKGTKLRLSARASVKSPKMQGGSGLTLDEIVKFDWEIALGDATLTLAELEALARLKSPLVKLRGQSHFTYVLALPMSLTVDVSAFTLDVARWEFLAAALMDTNADEACG